MDILRTPDDCFLNLPGFDHEPRYTMVDGVRIAHVTAGPASGPVVLLLHGEPSWSFLYRKMIPGLAAAGFRAVAPDLVGFGRSDKPASQDDYTYARHVAWMKAWLLANDLRDVTLFCQDWGGLIGLRLVAEEGDRFARVIAANTGLPTGDQPVGPAFHAWREASQKMPVFAAGRVVASAVVTPLAPDVIAAYDAPYPEERYKAGARKFPLLVPITPDDPAAAANRAAWDALSRWTKPFVTAFSDGDPITRGADALFQAKIPGAAGQPHTVVKGGGHFLQEDRGEELAAFVVRVCGVSA